MKIIRVKIKNFLGIGEADLDLDVSGVVLIQGDNQDSKTSSSNGSGKSSINESIYYGLYGKTKRGLTGDDVVNRYSGKDGCRVEVSFVIAGKTYTVLRTRGDKELGTALKLFAGKDDITKGTSALTQELIEDIVKVNSFAFEKIAFVGQGDVKPFAELTDKELKATFEDALGLRCLSDAYERLKIHKKRLCENDIKHGDKIVGYKNSIADITVKIAGYKEKEEYITANHKNIIKNIDVELCQLKQDLKNNIDCKKMCQNNINALTTVFISSYTEDIKNIEEKIQKIKELKIQLTPAVEQKTSSKHRFAIECENLLGKLKEITKSLTLAKTQRAEGCPTCKRPFDIISMSKYIETLQADYQAIQKAIEPAKGLLNNTITEENKLQELTLSLDEKIANFNKQIRALEIKYIEDKKSSEAADNKLSDIETQIDTIQRKIDKHTINLADITAEFNRQIDIVSEHILIANTEINMLNNNILQVEIERAEVVEKIKTSEYLEEALSNSGVKSYVFDSITPALNTYINEFLSTLDPALSVEVSTIKKLKSGDIREKFSVSVTNQYGGDSYAANSGGEKAKVNLAIALAFNKLIKQSESCIVEQIFLDEPFNELDDDASEVVVGILNSYAKEGGVFVISHSPAIKDIVSSKITVCKKGGKAVAYCEV